MISMLLLCSTSLHHLRVDIALLSYWWEGNWGLLFWWFQSRECHWTNFNTLHSASPQKSLKSGDLAYIPDNARKGTVVEESLTRSYMVRTPESHYWKNCRHLMPLPSTPNSLTNNTETLPEGVSWTKSGCISKPSHRLNLWGRCSIKFSVHFGVV